jgi:hypothetical protein
MIDVNVFIEMFSNYDPSHLKVFKDLLETFHTLSFEDREGVLDAMEHVLKKL